MLSVAMLCIIILSVAMLRVVILSVVMLRVVLLIVILLSALCRVLLCQRYIPIGFHYRVQNHLIQPRVLRR